MSTMEEQKLLKKKQRSILDKKNTNQYESATKALGDYYSTHGQYEKALDTFLELSNYYKAKGQQNIMEWGRADRMVGEMLMMLQKYQQALPHVENFLKIAKEKMNQVEEQRAYATLGRLHLLYGQNFVDLIERTKPLHKAELAFLKSLSVCKKLTGQIGRIELIDMEARLYLNLGVTKEYVGNDEETERYMEKALILCRENDLYELLHQCYLTTALFFHNKRLDDTKALRMLNLALTVAERLGKTKICETLIVKSDIFIKISDFQSAKQVLLKSYRLRSDNVTDRKIIEQNLRTVAAICKTEDLLITAGNSLDYGMQKKLFEKIGDGACQLKNYNKAISAYLNMLKFAELNGASDKELISSYISLYQTYLDLKDYPNALEYMWKEFELIKENPKEAAATLINIAETLDLSGAYFWNTDDCYQRARDACKKMKNIKLEKIVLWKQLKLREKHEMNSLAELLREDAALNNFNLDVDASVKGDTNDENNSGDENNLDDTLNDHDDDDESNNDNNEEENTPDIGADIQLSDLSCSEESDEEVSKQKCPTTSRRIASGSGGGGGLGSNSSSSCNVININTVKRNEKGETQLHQACISGNELQVRRLLDQGHPVNVRDFAGWMPLHEAANHGHLEIVRMLIEKGAPINDKGGKMCDGVTALHDACGNGCLDVAEELLNAGANSTILTDFQETPLDTLIKWRSSQKKIEMSEEIFYDTIRERLIELQERAGILNKRNTKTIDGISSKQQISPFKTTRSRRRIVKRLSIEESNSEEIIAHESNPSRININSIINEEFPEPEPVASSASSIASSDEEDDVHKSYLSPVQNPSTLNDDDKVKEYRSVMDTLRNRIVSPLKSPLKYIDTNKRRGGILDSQEVGEDWLENDVQFTTTKKRKMLSLNYSPLASKPSTSSSSSSTSNNTATNRQHKSPTVYQNSSKSTLSACDSQTKENSPIISSGDSCRIGSTTTDNRHRSDSDDNNSVDAFDLMMKHQPTGSNSSLNSLNTKNSIKRRLSLKSNLKNNSLLNAGFVQLLQKSRHSAENATDSGSENIVSSSQSNYTIEQSHQQQQQPQSRIICLTSPPKSQHSMPAIIPVMSSIKVKVDEQLFNVPITQNMINDLTIGWLAEEASRRCYNLKGLQPILQIITEDGAVFENTDPLSIVVGQTVSSNVLEWILPSLSQRYLESCKQLKIEPESIIQTEMELIQVTHSLQLENKGIRSIICKPMFKSLHHQYNLEVINLANNFIEDEGCKYLAEALPTLLKLKSLNLSGNHITWMGISMISNKVALTSAGSDDNKILSELESLNFNYNPLTNKSVQYLAQLKSNLKQITSLQLCSTDITEFSLQTPSNAFLFNGIIDLDISFNCLELIELIRIFKQLNSSKIIRLNLAFSINFTSNQLNRSRDNKDNYGGGGGGTIEPLSQSIGEIITTFLQNGTLENLLELNLSGLKLDDGDIYEICQSLRRATKFKNFNLLQNLDIRWLGFEKLLEQLKVKQLNLEGCTNILDGFSGDISKYFTTKCEECVISVCGGTDSFKEIEKIQKCWQKINVEPVNCVVSDHKVLLSLVS